MFHVIISKIQFFKYLTLFEKKKNSFCQRQFRLRLINYFKVLPLLNFEFFIDTSKLTYSYQKNISFYLKITTGFCIYHCNVTWAVISYTNKISSKNKLCQSTVAEYSEAVARRCSVRKVFFKKIFHWKTYVLESLF